MVNCSAILLAAGKSTRMGSLKALLPWEGTTLLQYQLHQFTQSQANQLNVVLGYQSSNLLPYVKNYQTHIVLNEDFEIGKTESIKRAIQVVDKNADCIIIASVDQPVNFQLIDTMIQQFAESNNKIIIPVFHGKRGHPILFSGELREELLQIKEESLGLKAIIHNRKEDIFELDVQDSSVLLNFNSPKDYEGGSKRDESF